MNCACEHDGERFTRLCALHHFHAERDRALQTLEIEDLRSKLQQAVGLVAMLIPHDGQSETHNHAREFLRKIREQIATK